MKHIERLSEEENKKLKTLRELLYQAEQQVNNNEFADYSLDKILQLIDSDDL